VPGVFVTGTGTNVGKTFVAAELIFHLKRLGQPVRAHKPVVTGFTAQTAAGSDCAALLEALGEPISSENIEAVSPWRYRAALGPNHAAALEGKCVDFAAISAYIADVQRASPAEFTVIEGLGGVMVPLGDEHTLLDMLSSAGLPVILVAGTYLGSLSHTLTALEVVFARGIPLVSVIVNDSGASAVTLDQTASALAPFVKKTGAQLIRLRRDPTPAERRTMCETVLLACGASPARSDAG
jgi:dethiobiotin synthetase